MNIYRLDMSFEIEYENEIAWSVDYVVHEKEFTQEEFYNICKKALKRCEDATMYDLKNALVSDGFSSIKSVARFEFAEE